MYQTLLRLEKDFFKLSCISDRNWLENIIHDSFTECGKSGLLFDKQQTVQDLLNCTADRNIDIYNFECSAVDEKTWIVHYITCSDGRQYYRTSLWVMEDTLRLYFHQASELNMKIDLENI